MTASISMRSRKQHIRIWFECVKLCLEHDLHVENFKKSAKFYEEWGEIKAIKFDAWWKEKQHLFEDKIVREVTKVSKTPNVITISIPLDENISSITKQVKALVESKQIEKLTSLGIDPTDRKSQNAANSKYAFTQKELKGLFHYINLEIYKIYLDLRCPPINRKFLLEVRRNFDARPRSLLKKSVVNLPQINDFDDIKRMLISKILSAQSDAA